MSANQRIPVPVCPDRAGGEHDGSAAGRPAPLNERTDELAACLSGTERQDPTEENKKQAPGIGAPILSK